MIIILDGSSSAGKTSIIKELQNISDKPLLHTGVDRFWAMIPDQYKENGSKAHEGYLFSSTVDRDNNPIIHVQKGPFAHQIDDTLPRVIKTLADCGHDIAVDTIINTDAQLHNYAKILSGYTVYFIGVVCDLKELEKREQSRGNRMLGLARGHNGTINTHKNYYDLIIDSTHQDPTSCAQNILNFIKTTPDPQGFKKLQST